MLGTFGIRTLHALLVEGSIVSLDDSTSDTAEPPLPRGNRSAYCSVHTPTTDVLL